MGGIAMALLEEMLAKTPQNMALLEEREIVNPGLPRGKEISLLADFITSSLLAPL